MADQRTVLVVDSDTEDRLSTVMLLEGAGYQVQSAGNFEEAKTLLAARSPDILITDLRLGPYNGLHLVLRSRIDHPEMAALVTTRVADPVLEAEAHRQQAQFLLRPITDSQLLAAISATLPPAVPEAPTADLC